MTRLFLKNFISFILFIAIMQPAVSQNQSQQGGVQWLDLQTAQTFSNDDGKPIFVFVEAEWCGFCKKMKAEVFPDKDVNNYLKNNYHAVLIDLDSKKEVTFNNESTNERNFAREMRVMQTPTMIFINSDGEVLGRQPGYLDKNDFHSLLQYVQSDDFGRISFEEFSTSQDG